MLPIFPALSLGPDTSFCEGLAATFYADPGFDTYLWHNGSSALTYTSSVAEIIWVTASHYCGFVTDSVEIKAVHPLPVVDLGEDREVCENSSTTLDAFNSGSTFLWSTGETTQTITVATEDIYYVTVTSPEQCESSDFVRVDIDQLPVINLGEDTILCEGKELMLDVFTPDATYIWNDGSEWSQLLVKTPGRYFVRVTNFCGTTRDEIDVDYENCECKVYMPNSFTPNNDGYNDIFKAEAQCQFVFYNLTIFNRLGEKVFEF